MAHRVLTTLLDVLAAQERTTSWLARKTGKSVPYVWRITQGQRRPTDEFKRQAAEVLGVPASVLFPEE